MPTATTVARVDARSVGGRRSAVPTARRPRRSPGRLVERMAAEPAATRALVRRLRVPVDLDRRVVDRPAHRGSCHRPGARAAVAPQLPLALRATPMRSTAVAGAYPRGLSCRRSSEHARSPSGGRCGGRGLRAVPVAASAADHRDAGTRWPICTAALPTGCRHTIVRRDRPAPGASSVGPDLEQQASPPPAMATGTVGCRAGDEPRAGARSSWSRSESSSK